MTPGGLDHLAVQVDDLDATRAELAAAGLDVGPVELPGGPDGPHTASLFDPDGYRLELVQWPPGHPVAMTERRLRVRAHARDRDDDGARYAIRLDMAMSLDGFVAGPDDRLGQEMGRGGFRLFDWLDDREARAPTARSMGGVATSAVITGRRTFELPAAGTATTTTVSRSTCSPTTSRGDVRRNARFYTDVRECAAQQGGAPAMGP